MEAFKAFARTHEQLDEASLDIFQQFVTGPDTADAWFHKLEGKLTAIDSLEKALKACGKFCGDNHLEANASARLSMDERYALQDKVINKLVSRLLVLKEEHGLSKGAREMKKDLLALPETQFIYKLLRAQCNYLMESQIARTILYNNNNQNAGTKLPEEEIQAAAEKLFLHGLFSYSPKKSGCLKAPDFGYAADTGTVESAGFTEYMLLDRLKYTYSHAHDSYNAGNMQAKLQLNTTENGTPLNDLEDTSEDRWQRHVGSQKLENRELIDKMLSSLSPAEREILESHYLEGREMGEIAQSAGIGRSSARSVKNRALEKLREKFQAEITH